MAMSPEDPDLSIVKETPGIVATPESVLKDKFSSSIIIETSTEFPDQLCSLSLQNSASSSQSPHSLVTPERNVIINTNSPMPETESRLNLSVNSCTRKRRKSLSSSVFIHQQAEGFDTPDSKTPGCVSFMESSVTSTYTDGRNGCGGETKVSEIELKKFSVPQSLTMDGCDILCETSSHVMDKRLQIFCLLCRNPLGLPENNLYVTCSIMSSSKVHLATLWKENLEPLAMNTIAGVPLVLSDISSVDQRLCNRMLEGAAGQGIWCKEDGCVFNTIFCPFCSNPSYCLGVQVMATDASNIQLLNKMLFYLNRLEIKNLEVPKGKDLSPSSGSCIGKNSVMSAIEKFSFSPQQQNLGGWRTTRSKMRLPKRGMLSSAES